MTRQRRRAGLGLMPALAASLLMGVWPVWAQYKVVAPDGRVTYTDRPVATPGAKVQTMSPSGTVQASPTLLLPLELRPVVARFPVVLLTASECAPCDSGRGLLRQRGIPFTERSVSSDDDVAALLRLSSARTLPVLTVGQQVQRGWQEGEWQALLDLAGYPAQSRLPRDYSPPPVSPLVARAPETTAPAPPAVGVAPAARPAPDTPPGQPQIRF